MLMQSTTKNKKRTEAASEKSVSFDSDKCVKRDKHATKSEIKQTKENTLAAYKNTTWDTVG